MQQINMNNVHVKVQCDNEFRRFVLAEVTYSKLVDTIRTLLRLAANSTVKLSYLDDENDWVLFSTDSELQYAVTLSKSPLKISVAVDSPVVDVATPQACPFSFPLNAEGVEAEHPWKWRGGRGGRGCRGGRRGECENKVERISAKLARLNERHAVLTAKLIESDLPQEKVRAIEWRLSHLQNKIDALKAKQEHIDACATKQEEHTAPVEQTETDETPKDEEPCERVNHHHFGHHGPRGGWGHGPHGHGFGHHHGHGHPRWGQRGPHCHRFGELPPSEGHPFGGEHPHPPFPFPHEFGAHPHPHPGQHGPRGGCKRGERGEHGCEGKGPKFFVYACSIPEGKAAFDRVHAAKEAVMAARRDKAEKEEIIAKLEELKEAKAAWRAIKVALWKEKKEAQRAAGCPRKQAK
jgi:hypothetical protein